MTDITADPGSAPLGPAAGGAVAVAAPTQRVAPALWRLLLRRPTFLVGAVYMVATLVADVLYTVLNPRLRVGVSQ